MSEPLTVDDVDQIVEGIENFIMNGDPKVDAIWQPYVDKLKTSRSLVVAAPDLLEALKGIDAFARTYHENTGEDAPGNSYYAGLLMVVVKQARAAIAKAEGQA